MEVKHLDLIFQQKISRILYKNIIMTESVLYCLFNVFEITVRENLQKQI